MAIMLHLVVTWLMMPRSLLCAPKLPPSTLKMGAVYFLEASVHPHKATARFNSPEAHIMNSKKQITSLKIFTFLIKF
jgi:hypothetical protein